MIRTTYLGTIFKNEWVALFSVDFGIHSNGVHTMGTLELMVSLPMMGLTGRVGKPKPKGQGIPKGLLAYQKAKGLVKQANKTPRTKGNS